MKIVTAKNKGIAAGRDVNINVSLTSGKIDLDEFLKDLENKTGLRKEQLLQVVQLDDLSIVSAEALQRSLQQLLFGQSLSEGYHSGKFLDMARGFEDVAAFAKDLSTQFSDLHRFLGFNDFQKAHKIIGNLLENPHLPADFRSALAYEYFQTGYIHYANSGDRDSISRLYERSIGEFSDIIDPKLLCLLAEMQQEIATRELDDRMLIAHKKSLDELRIVCAKDPGAEEHHKVLIGLCLRRLGERGNLSALDESISIHRQLLLAESSRPIELTTNFANALIRRFEAVRDANDLEEARRALEALAEPENTISLSEFQAYPKAQNALGNTFKQQVGLHGSSEAYAYALEAYTRAEKYWSEHSEPYEWAMIQKNKAETVLFLALKTTVSSELIDKAIDQIEKSLAHRTKAQAPYQFERTRKIRDQLLELQALGKQ